MWAHFQTLEAGLLVFLALLLITIIVYLAKIRADIGDHEKDRKFISDLIDFNKKLREENLAMQIKIKNWERAILERKSRTG